MLGRGAVRCVALRLGPNRSVSNMAATTLELTAACKQPACEGDATTHSRLSYFSCRVRSHADMHAVTRITPCKPASFCLQQPLCKPVSLRTHLHSRDLSCELRHLSRQLSRLRPESRLYLCILGHHRPRLSCCSALLIQLWSHTQKHQERGVSA